MDKLKPIISNSSIQIERKNIDHLTVPNFTSYLLLTNHKDAVPLSDGDRRYCIIFSRVQSEEQLFNELGGKEASRNYFDELFDVTRSRPDAIARFLLDWKIPKSFDPNGRAPETSYRLEMKALSVSPDKDVLQDTIYTNHCEVINETVLDITWLNKLSVMAGIELPKNRTVSAILSEMGYSPIEGRKVKLRNRDSHYVWIKKTGIETQNFENDVRDKIRDFHDKGENEQF